MPGRIREARGRSPGVAGSARAWTRPARRCYLGAHDRGFRRARPPAHRAVPASAGRRRAAPRGTALSRRAAPRTSGTASRAASAAAAGRSRRCRSRGTARCGSTRSCTSRCRACRCRTSSAIVDLPEGVSVRCNLIDVEPDPEAIRFGMPVEMTTGVSQQDSEGNDVVAFYFRPVRARLRRTLMAADVFVVGVGMLKFGRYPDKDVPELGGEAALLALDDAGLDDPATSSCWPRATCSRRTPWSASASCSRSARPASRWSTSPTPAPPARPRSARRGCAVGVGRVRRRARGRRRADGQDGPARRRRRLRHPHRGRDRQRPHAGGLRPGRHGAHAQVRHDAGAVRQGLGEEPPALDAQPALAVPDRDAARGGARTRAMVAYPNTLYMCCPTGDGAAAAVLVSAEKARQLGAKREGAAPRC